MIETIKQIAGRLEGLTITSKPEATLYNFAFGALLARLREPSSWDLSNNTNKRKTTTI